jgi:hypothetical protein
MSVGLQTKIICQPILYLDQACVRMLYIGVQTADHVYIEWTVLFSLAQIECYTHSNYHFMLKHLGRP